MEVILICAIAVGLMQALTVSSVTAQQVQPGKWFKVCAKQVDNNICNLQYQVVASTGQIITSVNLFTVTGKVNRKVFQITVPTNRLIPVGIAIKIDSKKESRIPYVNCFADRCTAETELSDSLVKSLKAGNEMVLTSTNFQNKASPIKISLKGFTTAFDGPPLKKSDIEAKNLELQKQLEEKARKTREALEEAQKKAVQ